MSTSPETALQELQFDSAAGSPLHLQLRSALRQAIDEHFEDGQSFWTEAVLVEHLSLSRGTVRQALQELAREGLLVRRARHGSVVCKSTTPLTIGVFVPQYDSDFFNGVLEHLSSECQRSGMRLRIYHTHQNENTAQILDQVERPSHEERVVLLGTGDITRALFDELEARGYATVAIDSLTPRYPGRYVGTDNARGVHIGLTHLWELGHRNITLLVNEPGHVQSVRDRVQAFQDFMAEHGGCGQIVECHTPLWSDSFEAAFGHMDELWQAPHPTAIFTVSDPGAWAALKWFSRRGIRVPDEVSVLGFEGVRQSRFTNPALTTVAHPMQALAVRALEMLAEENATRDFLPPALIARESTGPVSADATAPTVHLRRDAALAS